MDPLTNEALCLSTPKHNGKSITEFAHSKRIVKPNNVGIFRREKTKGSKQNSQTRLRLHRPKYPKSVTVTQAIITKMLYGYIVQNI